ncbi:hypothetical protein [Streptomyces longispororuber]|uniref:hypothetical protein n=1 Tax=Streptomyces longispororuber TaxID=68230 RepID=UPI0036FEEA0B
MNYAALARALDATATAMDRDPALTPADALRTAAPADLVEPAESALRTWASVAYDICGPLADLPRRVAIHGARALATGYRSYG